MSGGHFSGSSAIVFDPDLTHQSKFRTVVEMNGLFFSSLLVRALDPATQKSRACHSF
jgi:hypothetical protein